MPFLARGDARLRGGHRHGRGHRCRCAGRPQPSDGSARAGRLHRPRRLPRHHARARRRLRRRSLPPAAHPDRAGRRPAISARRPARASTPTRVRSPRRPDGDRRPDRGGAAAPGDRPRLRHARARAGRHRARRGRAVRPLAVREDGRARADRRAAPRGGRRGGVLVPRLDAGHGGARRRPTWRCAVSLSVHILSQYPVVTWGTPEQHARWLPAMLSRRGPGRLRPDRAACRQRCRGDPDPGRAGRARRRADGLPADGTKIWITNAPEADRYLVFATLDPSAGAKAITAFLVEKGTPGFRFGAHEQKMGIRPVRPPS